MTRKLTEVEKTKRRKAARRVREAHRRLEATGGRRVTVTLHPQEVRALQAMSGYMEPVAYQIRRICMERALELGLVSPGVVPPRMESGTP